jgi:broad specificity phosphatase PhoE
MSIPFNIKDKFWDVTHPGMMRRIKHRLILVRHGESESNIELTTTGKTSEFSFDHALTDVGKEQAQDIANFLETKGLEHIDRIEISPLDRAVQTAMPCLFKNPIADYWMREESNIGSDIYIAVNFDLREKYSKQEYECSIPFLDNVKKGLQFPFIYYKNYDQVNKNGNKDLITRNKWIREPDTNFEGRVEELLNTWKKIGSIDNRNQTLVFAHSQLIAQLLSSDKDKSFHLANGSISIIDIDEDNHLHIQVANYTKHLHTPTGMHTCIF